MLPESRLFSFFDQEKNLNIQFFEGQKLTSDLSLVHEIKGAGFAYFRDFVLSFQPMISLLKFGESFGIYIDSSEPYFRLKIETNESGLMRSLLIPENFDQFPSKISGIVRLSKFFPKIVQPYESIIHVNNKSLGEIVNQLLQESFQVNSSVMVAPNCDQSLLLHVMPPVEHEKLGTKSPFEAEKLLESYRINFLQIFDRFHTNSEDIIQAFEGLGFRYLGSKEVGFHCGCSKERMVQNISSLQKQSEEDLFEEGKDVLEIRCDYCKTNYQVHRNELS